MGIFDKLNGAINDVRQQFTDGDLHESVAYVADSAEALPVIAARTDSKAPVPDNIEEEPKATVPVETHSASMLEVVQMQAAQKGMLPDDYVQLEGSELKDAIGDENHPLRVALEKEQIINENGAFRNGALAELARDDSVSEFNFSQDLLDYAMMATSGVPTGGKEFELDQNDIELPPCEPFAGESHSKCDRGM